MPTTVPENKKILVVGGGNTAAETACLLSEKNKVFLFYRQPQFFRLNPVNLNKLKEKSRQDWIDLLLNTDKEIRGYLNNAKMLGLNKSQIKKIENIEEDLSATLIKKRADLQLAVLKFRKLMIQEMPSSQAVLEQIDKMTNLSKEIQTAAVMASLNARKVLPKEQLENATKMPMPQISDENSSNYFKIVSYQGCDLLKLNFI
ncbi:MAG: NAD(P)-binding domain-containing protein [Candidatus Desulfofervidaceae bacterium]|nr:NAD(P)-binding domain-containing protein [Candidatus Desulfofervidaceae bacterium]